jgi:hypothetical protein
VQGWDVLIRAYFSEFKSGENVLLVILTNAYHGPDDFERQVQSLMHEHPSGSVQPRVHFLSGLPQVEYFSTSYHPIYLLSPPLLSERHSSIV